MQLPQAVTQYLKTPSPRLRRVAGGDTCQAFQLPDAPDGALFLKMRRDAPADFFAAEAQGLAALARSKAVRVPKVIAWGKDFLLLEYIRFGAQGADFWLDCADALAALHNCIGPHFGFSGDNYCGAAAQLNPAHEDGHLFFARARLGHQAMLAVEHGLLSVREAAAVERIGKHLVQWIPQQPPSLLHGDLWAGNIHCSSEGSPVLADPAVYWGWAEADLAMTQLFGSPPAAFFHRYQEQRPLAPSWEERVPLYNLYHLLNHLNLFGRQWHDSVRSILGTFA